VPTWEVDERQLPGKSSDRAALDSLEQAGPGENLICVAYTLVRKPPGDVIWPQVLSAVSVWRPVRPAGTRCAVWRQVGVENCRVNAHWNPPIKAGWRRVVVGTFSDCGDARR
jgi:hypothetical protein